MKIKLLNSRFTFLHGKLALECQTTNVSVVKTIRLHRWPEEYSSKWEILVWMKMEQALTLRVKTNQWAIVTMAAWEGGGEDPAPCQRSQVFLFLDLCFCPFVTNRQFYCQGPVHIKTRAKGKYKSSSRAQEQHISCHNSLLQYNDGIYVFVLFLHHIARKHDLKWRTGRKRLRLHHPQCVPLL